MASTSILEDSPFIKCLKRETTTYTPVWIMRQAGRYMREYREIRSRVGFLELCKTPDLAAEVTVMAVEQLGVDAAIIFADILLPLEPLQLQLRFSKGDGPVIEKPIRTGKDVDALPPVEPLESLDFVFEAIRLSCRALGSRVPLIGFAGAPFTLASYAIEGGASKNYEQTKGLMYADADAWHKLMVKLSDITFAYLKAQIQAGASAVQLFDSWVGALSPLDYERFVLPHMIDLIGRLKGQAPVIYFGTMTGGMLDLMSASNADVIGVDWRVQLDKAWAQIGYERGIQGNLDPLVLLSNKAEIERQTRIILDKAAGRPGHIFNLGHGVLPETPPEHVRYLVQLVHQLTQR